MASTFNLALDTAPPANPSVVLNGGAAYTAAVDVLLEVKSSDYPGGAADVTQMLVWGSVNPADDPNVQATEPESTWRPYVPQLTIELSAGAGRKYIYARLRDDVGNESPSVVGFIDLATSLPAVTITTPVDHGRISMVEDFDEATFSWECDTDFVQYEVRAVPSIGSPHTAGVKIGTTNGSLNVGALGAFPAVTPITTTIKGADLLAASPGSTKKIIKVFCADDTGQWSP